MATKSLSPMPLGAILTRVSSAMAYPPHLVCPRLVSPHVNAVLSHMPPRHHAASVVGLPTRMKTAHSAHFPWAGGEPRTDDDEAQCLAGGADRAARCDDGRGRDVSVP